MRLICKNACESASRAYRQAWALGGVAVLGGERVAEVTLVEATGNLANPVWHLHRQLETEPLADLLEGDLVVARILVAVDEADFAAGDDARDDLDQVELAVVLVAVADVEDVAPDLVWPRLEHSRNRPRCIAHVHVRPPELLAEDFELTVVPEFAGELIDGQVEAHPRRCAVDRGEAKAGRYGRAVAAFEQHFLDLDLLFGVEGDRRQRRLLVDRRLGVSHAPVV